MTDFGQLRQEFLTPRLRTIDIPAKAGEITPIGRIVEHEGMPWKVIRTEPGIYHCEEITNAEAATLMEWLRENKTQEHVDD